MLNISINVSDPHLVNIKRLNNNDNHIHSYPAMRANQLIKFSYAIVKYVSLFCIQEFLCLRLVTCSDTQNLISFKYLSYDEEK